MRNVIILGTGRSGTSLTAGILSSAGYFMGDQVYGANVGNPKGQFEDHEINAINEDILATVTPSRPPLIGNILYRHRPGRWQRWLAALPLDVDIVTPQELALRMEALVRESPFCFKDPRFSYTLPAWRPFLHDTVYVCVFRNPADTVASILKHVDRAHHLRGFRIDRERAFRVWVQMYRHIVEKHRQRGEWLFVHYSQLLTNAGLGRLEAFTEAPVDSSFPDRALHRSKTNTPIPAPVATMYESLCHLAEYEERSMLLESQTL